MSVETEISPRLKLAQEDVFEALEDLEPPDQFATLTEVQAAILVDSGIIPGAPLFEPFLEISIRALIQRVRGICTERGIELPELEPEHPAPVERGPFSWWHRSGA